MRNTTLASCLAALALLGCDSGATVSPDAAPSMDAAPDTARGDAASGDGGCVAGRTCAECGMHRACTPPLGCGDAVCGGCVSGFVEDESGACREIQPPAECEAEKRVFVMVNVAGYCGDCVAGTEEHAGRCVLPGDGECRGSTDRTYCGAERFCLQMDVDDEPLCRGRPCAPGQSWDRKVQRCKGCPQCVGAEWPVSDRSGECVCDPGVDGFWSDTHSLSMKCDSDQDGWFHQEVAEELDVATQMEPWDYSILLNVRCAIPVFTKVVLKNEWGQTHDLTADEMNLSSPMAVPMYEYPTNDQGQNQALADLGLSHSSVNSLTKACRSDRLDLNQNGVSDVDEDQREDLANPTLVAWARPYLRLTHFIELHEVRFLAAGETESVKPCQSCPELPIKGRTGTLVIEERSRCDEAPFDLLGYAASCTRRRDSDFRKPEYSGGNTELTYDFAAFECDAMTYPTNRCPTPAPPLGPGVPGKVPPHGLCDGGDASTLPWRGMTHYSQFRCAQILAPLSTATRNSQVRIEDLGQWQPQKCTATGQVSAAPAPGTVAQFACAIDGDGVAQNEVTWLVRSYQKGQKGGVVYTGGCIDEGYEWWAQLCPGREEDVVVGNDENYGVVVCGPSCPKDETYHGGGFWLCSFPTAGAFIGADAWTAPDPSPPPTPSPKPLWRLQAEIPLGIDDYRISLP